MPDTKRILALDPAALTGFCHSNGQSGTWNIANPKDVPGMRLSRFRHYIRNYHLTLGFDVLAYEDASFGGINRNTQAAHNELAGIIKMVAAELGVELVCYKPMSIKSFAGIGKGAGKQAAIIACNRIFNRFPQDDNEADAIIICEMAKRGYQPQKAAKRKKKVGNPLQGKLFGKIRRAPINPKARG